MIKADDVVGFLSEEIQEASAHVRAELRNMDGNDHDYAQGYLDALSDVDHSLVLIMQEIHKSKQEDREPEQLEVETKLGKNTRFDNLIE